MTRARELSRWQGYLLVGAAVTVVLSIPASRAAHAGGGASTARPRAAKTPPGELTGTWEVERVLADLADQPHWGIRPNDPSLLYRSMSVEADKVRLAGQEKSCTQSSWAPLDISWQGLFKKSGLSRVNNEGATEVATPMDYDLELAGSDRVRAYLLCSRPGTSGDRAWRGAGWLALLGQDRLIVRHTEQNLLVLRRRPAAERARASFPCERPASATEKLLCGQPELAAWDRSVAEAFRQAMERQVDAQDRAALLKSQVAWKAERDRCGSDSACVDEALWRRVEALMQK